MKHLTTDSTASVFNSDNQRYSPNPCVVGSQKGGALTFSLGEQNSVKVADSNKIKLQIDDTAYLQPKSSAPDVYLDLTDNYLPTGNN